MQTVLFLCIHNSARSQMAAAYLKKLGSDRFIAESAGIEGGKLNPFAVKVLLEEEIDISKNTITLAEDLLHAGKQYDYVISVCDEASAERCPVFPGKHVRLHWSFQDPSTFTGTNLEKLDKTRKVRDEIKKRVKQFIAETITL